MRLYRQMMAAQRARDSDIADGILSVAVLVAWGSLAVMLTALWGD
jgi:hypothetical protein